MYSDNSVRVTAVVLTMMIFLLFSAAGGTALLTVLEQQKRAKQLAGMKATCDAVGVQQTDVADVLQQTNQVSDTAITYAAFNSTMGLPVSAQSPQTLALPGGWTAKSMGSGGAAFFSKLGNEALRFDGHGVEVSGMLKVPSCVTLREGTGNRPAGFAMPGGAYVTPTFKSSGPVIVGM